jgi:hypothetical protein
MPRGINQFSSINFQFSFVEGIVLIHFLSTLIDPIFDARPFFRQRPDYSVFIVLALTH